MLTEVKKHIELIFVSFKFNLLKEMEYRVAFISKIIGMILNNGSFIIQWVILFSIKDNIGGYDFRDVMYLWAIASTSFGIWHVFFFNSFNISNLILTGKLDSYLVQPKNVLINVCSSNSSASALGDVIYGYIILLFLKVDLMTFITFTIVSIISGIIHTAFSVIVQSSAFWIRRADNLSNSIFNAYLMPSTYPEGIFKGFVKLIFFTVLPVGFIVYIPVRILLDFNILTFISLVSFTVLIVFIATFVFYKGLRKYSSSNLMIVRT